MRSLVGEVKQRSVPISVDVRTKLVRYTEKFKLKRSPRKSDRQCNGLNRLQPMLEGSGTGNKWWRHSNQQSVDSTTVHVVCIVRELAGRVTKGWLPHRTKMTSIGPVVMNRTSGTCPSPRGLIPIKRCGVPHAFPSFVFLRNRLLVR